MTKLFAPFSHRMFYVTNKILNGMFNRLPEALALLLPYLIFRGRLFPSPYNTVVS